MARGSKKYSLTGNVDLASVICYPSAGRSCFNKRVRELLSHGINYIVSEGRHIVNKIRVLGKGHSAIVVKALHSKYGLVALKLRRSDSKRDSLILECRLMKPATPVAPKPIVCSDDFVIMEFVDGESLEEFIKTSVTSCRDAVLLLVKVMAASYWLDAIGIDHKELSIAGKHVIISRNGSVKIIDYESAAIHHSPCNLCRSFSWIVMRRRLLQTFCGVSSEFIDSLVDLIRKYKLTTSLVERRELLSLLIRQVHKLVVHHDPKISAKGSSS